MMYIAEQHTLGYIAHPKTASSATQRVIREHLGGVVFGNHHSVEEGHCRRILDHAILGECGGFFPARRAYGRSGSPGKLVCPR